MIIVYAFIGNLPSYCIQTVYQTRLFFNGDIYFIVSDLNSVHISELQNKYNVKIINYNEVKNEEFQNLLQLKIKKFEYCKGLIGREWLFVYSFERFYILLELMKMKNLENVFFMELDNLIYDDPRKWLISFSKSDMAFMFDNYNRCSSGICYIKNTEILNKFLTCCSDYISNSNNFLTEMETLYIFWEKNKDIVQLLPIHWNVEPKDLCCKNFDLYQSIFDAAPIGIFLCGKDPYHTNGRIVTGQKWSGSLIDFTQNRYDWKTDENNLKIPYILNHDKWIRINNLHIHSKNLLPYVSK
jgi:hypothetical protein